jgi:tetratricopeptide (TPR) repeat protein
MPHHYTELRLLVKGQIDDALASVRRAQEIEPLAAIFSANIGMIYYYGHRYEEAVRQLETTLAMDAGFDHARSYLGRAYLRMGEGQKAIEEFGRRTSITIGSVADLPAAHALMGRGDVAIAELERLLTTARERYVSAYDVATVYAAWAIRRPLSTGSSARWSSVTRRFLSLASIQRSTRCIRIRDSNW